MTYRVHVTFATPAWDERNGFDYHITASSKMAAIRIARRRAYNDGHTGRLNFRATETEEASD